MTTAQLLDRPPDVSVGNIPGEVDAFVGREHAIARLRKLQSETRLLTLVGPSGVGKTRLALRLEAQVAQEFPTVPGWST
jgi:non-specific serine/threonine protein kinase